MNSFLFVLWDQNPEIWPDLLGPLRWYGLLFALGFFLGQIVITYIFKMEGKPEKDVDALTYYMIGATIIGARLGHCFFYDPEYYLSNPIEIFKVWKGGLASHGATVGILVAMWLYARKRPDQSWLWILDRIVIVVALGGACIRFGNLMNSEIVGKASSLPWATVFVNPLRQVIMERDQQVLESLEISKIEGDTTIDGSLWEPLKFRFTFKADAMPGNSMQAYTWSTMPHHVEAANLDEVHIYYQPQLSKPVEQMGENGRNVLELRVFGKPRHPAMVYESISTLLLFGFLFWYWKRNLGGLPEGKLFAIFVVVLFSLRFLYEFLKENQVDFEDGLPLNMGQFLSIPLVLFGLYWLLRKPKPDLEKD